MFKIFKGTGNKDVEDKKIGIDIEKSIEMSSREQFQKNVADIIYDNYDIFILYLKVINEFLYRLKFKPEQKEIYISKNKCELGEIEKDTKKQFGEYCISNFIQFFLEINYMIEKNNSSKNLLTNVFSKNSILELLNKKLETDRMKILIESMEEAKAKEFNSYNKWYEEDEEEKVKIKEMLAKIYEIEEEKNMEELLNRILYKIKYGSKCNLSLKEYINTPYNKHNEFENIRYWVLQLYLASILASLAYTLKNTKKLKINKELIQILENLLAEADEKDLNFTEDSDMMDKFYLIYKKFYPNTFDRKLNRYELYVVASSIGFMQNKIDASGFSLYDEYIEAFGKSIDFEEFIDKIDIELFINYKNVAIGYELCSDIYSNKALFEELFDLLYLKTYKLIPDEAKVPVLIKRHLYVDKLMYNYLFKNLQLEKERLLGIKK